MASLVNRMRDKTELENAFTNNTFSLKETENTIKSTIENSFTYLKKIQKSYTSISRFVRDNTKSGEHFYISKVTSGGKLVDKVCLSIDMDFINQAKREAYHRSDLYGKHVTLNDIQSHPEIFDYTPIITIDNEYTFNYTIKPLANGHTEICLTDKEPSTWLCSKHEIHYVVAGTPDEYYTLEESDVTKDLIGVWHHVNADGTIETDSAKDIVTDDITQVSAESQLKKKVVDKELIYTTIHTKSPHVVKVMILNNARYFSLKGNRGYYSDNKVMLVTDKGTSTMSNSHPYNFTIINEMLEKHRGERRGTSFLYFAENCATGMISPLYIEDNVVPFNTYVPISSNNLKSLVKKVWNKNNEEEFKFHIFYIEDMCVRPQLATIANNPSEDLIFAIAKDGFETYEMPIPKESILFADNEDCLGSMEDDYVINEKYPCLYSTNSSYKINGAKIIYFYRELNGDFGYPNHMRYVFKYLAHLCASLKIGIDIDSIEKLYTNNIYNSLVIALNKTNRRALLELVNEILNFNEDINDYIYDHGDFYDYRNENNDTGDFNDIDYKIQKLRDLIDDNPMVLRDYAKKVCAPSTKYGLFLHNIDLEARRRKSTINEIPHIIQKDENGNDILVPVKESDFVDFNGVDYYVFSFRNDGMNTLHLRIFIDGLFCTTFIQLHTGSMDYIYIPHYKVSKNSYIEIERFDSYKATRTVTFTGLHNYADLEFPSAEGIKPTLFDLFITDEDGLELSRQLFKIYYKIDESDPALFNVYSKKTAWFKPDGQFYKQVRASGKTTIYYVLNSEGNIIHDNYYLEDGTHCCNLKDKMNLTPSEVIDKANNGELQLASIDAAIVTFVLHDANGKVVEGIEPISDDELRNLIDLGEVRYGVVPPSVHVDVSDYISSGSSDLFIIPDEDITIDPNTGEVYVSFNTNPIDEENNVYITDPVLNETDSALRSKFMFCPISKIRVYPISEGVLNKEVNFVVSKIPYISKTVMAVSGLNRIKIFDVSNPIMRNMDAYLRTFVDDRLVDLQYHIFSNGKDGTYLIPNHFFDSGETFTIDVSPYAYKICYRQAEIDPSLILDFSKEDDDQNTLSKPFDLSYYDIFLNGKKLSSVNIQLIAANKIKLVNVHSTKNLIIYERDRDSEYYGFSTNVSYPIYDLLNVDDSILDNKQKDTIINLMLDDKDKRESTFIFDDNTITGTLRVNNGDGTYTEYTTNRDGDILKDANGNKITTESVVTTPSTLSESTKDKYFYYINVICADVNGVVTPNSLTEVPGVEETKENYKNLYDEYHEDTDTFEVNGEIVNRLILRPNIGVKEANSVALLGKYQTCAGTSTLQWLINQFKTNDGTDYTIQSFSNSNVVRIVQALANRIGGAKIRFGNDGYDEQAEAYNQYLLDKEQYEKDMEVWSNLPNEGRVELFNADLLMKVSLWTPTISGTIRLNSAGKTLSLNIINLSDDSIIANDTFTNIGIDNTISYKLPSLLNPKAYEIRISCTDGDDEVAGFTATIDSAIVNVSANGKITLGEDIELHLVTNVNNIDVANQDRYVTSAETFSKTIPNLVANCSMDLELTGYYKTPMPVAPDIVSEPYANVPNGMNIEFDTSYDENLENHLFEMIKNASGGSIVKLPTDITIRKHIILDKSLTIDLCGCTLTSLAQTAFYTVNGDITVHFIDSSEDKSGKVHAIGKTEGMCIWNNGGVMEIHGGTWISDHDTTIYSRNDDAFINIYGGHFESSEPTLYNKYWVLNHNDETNSKITCYGGTYLNFDPANSNLEAEDDPRRNMIASGYHAEYTEDYQQYLIEKEAYDNLTDVEKEGVEEPQIPVGYITTVVPD